MIPLSQFLPYIAPYCPGASDPLIYQHLLLAARDFCTRAPVVQEITTQDAVAGTSEYEVETPSFDLTVARVMSIAFRATPLTLVASSDVVYPPALRGDVGAVTAEVGPPTSAYFKTVSGSSFWVYPIPDTTEAAVLTVRASYAPSNTARVLPDVLFDEYAEQIAYGTLQRLMLIPNQPFSSGTAATGYGALYSAAVTAAKRDATIGRVQASLAVQPRPFA